MNVVQQRARGVGIVGDVNSGVGQIPDQPAIDRAEEQIAFLGPPARAGYVVQNPANLGAREVRIDEQSGLRTDLLAKTLGDEVLANRGRLARLPDDGVIDRLAAVPVPHDRGLTLVRDADRGHLTGIDAPLGQQFGRRTQHRAQNFQGIVLHPARLRKNLRGTRAVTSPRPGRHGRTTWHGNSSSLDRERGCIGLQCLSMPQR